MRYFDFADQIRRVVREAKDRPTQWSASTTVPRAMFPTAVENAGFELLFHGKVFEPGEHDLVVGAAPWSLRDLEALDRLASIVRGSSVRVLVFDVDELPYPEMARRLPGLRMFLQTPVVLRYQRGELTYFGEGWHAKKWLEQF